MKKIFFLLQTFLLFLSSNTYSQNIKNRELAFTDYLKNVQDYNKAYAVEKLNVSISELNIASAKAFQDPELSIGYFDNGEKKHQLGFGYESELEWKLELGGKRKARINLAKSEYKLTQSILLNYFKNLKADATLIYFEALQNEKIFKVKSNSYEAMKELEKSDSIRFALGEISEINAKQSKIEALNLKNDVLNAEMNYQHKLIQLGVLMGETDYNFILNANFPSVNKEFDLNLLQNLALENRTDLIAALQSKEVSQRNIELAKANRAIDLGLKFGIEYNSVVRNEIAEAPKFTKIGGGVVIPLKFSNRRNNELKIAQLAYDQSQQLYDLAQLEVLADVNQAYISFISNKKQVQTFNVGLLEQAKIVLEGKFYSYKRGETSLLDVLDSQRTYNEIQEKYYETIFNYTAALVELERVTGTQNMML